MWDFVTQENIKLYQSAIVGVLGFTGVILTLLWNAFQARVARFRAIEHTRITTRIALRAELSVIQRGLSSAKETPKDDWGSFMFISIPASLVFNGLVKEIGSLKASQVEAVISAYAELSIFREMSKSYANAGSETVVAIKSEYHELIVSALEVTISHVNAAIKQLS